MRVITLALLLAASMARFAAAQSITVTGDAVVYAMPDKIVITLGIETWDRDIIAAKQKNSDILKKAVIAIKECGVAEKDIQTDYLSIEPRWKNNFERDEFIGYFVRNTFMVTLNDTKQIEELITKVLQAGVTNIHGVDFQTIEFKKYRQQARELALKAAKEKAAAMASVLDQSIGAPSQINENSTGSGGFYYSSWWGGGWGSRGGGMAQNAIQDMSGNRGEISDTIALGKISIHANVTVTFKLKE
ncbi:MAG: SIMPL domain-containing protein [Thermoguttaceae bacterium]|jgi:uncharacterized protein YggE